MINTRVEIMKTMYREGKTMQEIGEIYSLSKQRVSQLLIGHKQGGITIKKKLRAKANKKKRDNLYRRKFGHSLAWHKRVGLPHGTKTKYVQDRCRCKKCTLANRDSHALWSLNRRSKQVNK